VARCVNISCVTVDYIMRAYGLMKTAKQRCRDRRACLFRLLFKRSILKSGLLRKSGKSNQNMIVAPRKGLTSRIATATMREPDALMRLSEKNAMMRASLSNLSISNRWTSGLGHTPAPLQLSLYPRPVNIIWRNSSRQLEFLRKTRFLKRSFRLSFNWLL